MGAARILVESPLRFLGGLDFGNQPAGRRIRSGKRDAGSLANQAATAIAPDQVLAPYRPAVSQRDVDAGVVLPEAGHLAPAMDRHAQLVDPVGECALDAVLRQPEHVVVPRREVADERGSGEHRDLVLLPLRDEPIGDAALVEYFDRPREQAARARAGQILIGAPLDDGDVHAGQCQLARQHQPGRAAAGDHHRVFRRRHSPIGHWCLHDYASRVGGHPAARPRPSGKPRGVS